MFIDKSYTAALDAYHGGSEWRDNIPRYTTILTGFDMLMKKGGLDELADGLARDPFGCIWKLWDAPILVEAPLKDPSMNGYELPDVEDYYETYIKPNWSDEISRSVDGFRMGRHVAGLFERGWFLRGYENFLMDLIDHERFCREMIEKTADWLIGSIDRLLDAPIDAIILTEDYADQRGMVFGLERYRKFFLPQWKRVFDHIHKAGAYVVLHVCGNAEPALPGLNDIGLDCLESVQPEAMDAYHLKREYGRDLRFWGAVGVQQLMPFGTPDAVREEVPSLKRELGRGGGFVLNTATYNVQATLS